MKSLKHTIYFSICFALVFCAGVVSAQVEINEIAWQGYLGDANNEWIELYNSGSASVNLDGWLLESADGTPSINLSGLTISADSFLLLERTDDSTVPEESADLFYTGALSNSGENLTLKNADGVTQDSANFASGWLEVSDSSQTLVKINGSWSVGDPTPNDHNQEQEVSNSDENDDTNQESSNDSSNVNEDEETTSGSSSSREEKKPSYDSRKVTIQSVKNGYVGDPVNFSSHVRDFDGDEMKKGFYIWNMGDGNILYKKEKEDFEYTYHYPGEYVITLRYNKTMFGMDEDEREPDAFDERIVNISDKSIEISRVLLNGTVVLKNISNNTIDISGWRLADGNGNFIIPNNTKVRAGKTITFANTVTGFTDNSISLFTPVGRFAGALSHVPLASSVVRKSNNTESSLEIVSEEIFPSQAEVELIERSFADLEQEQLQASTPKVTNSNNTLTILLFIVVLVLAGFLVWYLLLDKKTNMVIEGYEIVEE